MNEMKIEENEGKIEKYLSLGPAKFAANCILLSNTGYGNRIVTPSTTYICNSSGDNSIATPCNVGKVYVSHVSIFSTYEN